MRRFQLFYAVLSCILIFSCTKAKKAAGVKNNALKALDTLTIKPQPNFSTDTIVNLAYLSDIEIYNDTSLANPMGYNLPEGTYTKKPPLIYIADRKHVDFRHVQLRPIQVFSTAGADMKLIFRGTTTFEFCKFDTLTYDSRVDRVEYEDTVWGTLDNSVFTDTLMFDNSQFPVPLTLRNNRFRGKVIFTAVSKNSISLKMSGPIFEKNIFENGLYFINDIKSNSSESRFNFKSNVTLTDSEFSGNLSFKGCYFEPGQTLTLENISLPDTIDLSDTKLTEVVDLTKMLPNLANNKCELNLLRADASKIRLQYHNFHLYFPDEVKANPLYTDLITSSYLSLLANFKTNGYEQSYHMLDVEFRDWQSEHELISKIDGIWWRYGYEKWRIMLWITLLVSVFTFVNYFFIEQLFTAYAIPSLKENLDSLPRHRSIFSATKAQISFFYTLIIFFKINLDFDKMHFKSKRLTFYILLQYALGLVCCAYLVNWIISK